jgi:hypothetical protein
LLQITAALERPTKTSWRNQMPSKKYPDYEGAEAYFELVRSALGDLVDGEHFFDIVADNIAYEVRYDLGWPRVIRGRAGLMAQFRGYEPSRVCRRLFRLSHAAMAGCSVTA